ncbi:tRNA threonylcarbamoyl adenosine modification protein YeaZ [Aliiruegeria haliotis]|uniref:tRNA threonylcarbamoyl adenosine modification protein YeaZ n=1 Tax=Aliiruegeria haliotis TaxID=1280846 RepID=A0A2T0RWL2_9RHOB|nr:tRNA (adenosine(37)-N6)-threonylcarbamoyltransferase complex dimerization subunit type 1 TsaB [Aliiruegeria haliotis]PRY25564.1 tRNA threonylcarbamoyl adenosine modification protein YeaZ [Aliiruegeria haliotis]
MTETTPPPATTGHSHITLAFDTSAAHCTAAVLAGGDILAHRHEEMARGQAERLAPLIEELLAEAGIAPSDLDAIGTGIGPGNFTGVRISVALARGLSLSVGIPAVGVSSLEALALDLPRPVLSSLDARRAGVYLQLADPEPEPPQLCPLDALPATLFRDGLVCVGDHAETLAGNLSAEVAKPVHPLAVAIARIAASRRHLTDLPRPAPLYLRAADAAPPADPPPEILP